MQQANAIQNENVTGVAVNGKGGEESDRLHAGIIAALKDKVWKMFKEASEDENSDANQMVHLLLLNQLTKMRANPSDKEFKTLISQEQRRHTDRERWRSSMDKERHARKMDLARLKVMEEKLKLAQYRYRDARKQVKDAQQVAKQAKTAAEQGHPMDALEVYNRIADIVGLRSPLKPIGPAYETGGAADRPQAQ